MYFRPYPVLTLFAVPALVALVTLGVWQAQRAGWKADEVATFEQRLAAPPLTIAEACAAGLAPEQIIEALQASGPVLRVFGNRATGQPGWRLFQAATICGTPVLVLAGFEPLDIGGPGGKSPKAPPPWPDTYIIEPWPEKPVMPGANSPASNEWYWLDAPAMAAALGQPSLETRFLVTPVDGMPDFLVRTPPATHIGYSVTWFGIAIAFVVIYGLFHVRAGRLRFGKAQGKAQGKAE